MSYTVDVITLQKLIALWRRSAEAATHAMRTSPQLHGYYDGLETAFWQCVTDLELVTRGDYAMLPDTVPTAETKADEILDTLLAEGPDEEHFWDVIGPALCDWVNQGAHTDSCRDDIAQLLRWGYPTDEILTRLRRVLAAD